MMATRKSKDELLKLQEERAALLAIARERCDVAEFRRRQGVDQPLLRKLLESWRRRNKSMGRV